jgi:hypothetical protein
MAELLYDVIRYLLGVTIVALVTTSIKLFKDNLVLKKDVALLQEQRKADLIESASAKAMATAVKNETGIIKAEMESRMRDLMGEFTKQLHQNTLLFTEAINQVKNTLTEVNTTLKHIGGDVERLKDRNDV